LGIAIVSGIFAIFYSWNEIMDNPKRYLVTSALPYANGLKHVGHLAGAYIPADIYVRYLRAQKRDVVYVCGSDEHGTAIPIQAVKEGTTPRIIIDKYHEAMKQDFEDLAISFDIYHRTSEQLHHATAQEFFTYLYERGELETKETEQFYDEEAKSFLADRYIKGICPNCGSDRAFGDQCENCGTSLSPDELINPVSTLSGNIPVKKKTTHWFLPLGKHESFLREWILEQHKDDWRPTVLGQCRSWIEAGLQSRAVTRDLDWGIKVPLKEAEGKVLYVWFDAPIGYISATKQWAADNKKDWEPYWYDKETKLVHFVGKDNIVFHCIIFPIMLKLHGNILPANVPANEFLNLEGDKMSTSRNWNLEMRDYINDFVKKENGGGQCVDMLRYYLTQIAPETKDSEFTWKGFQDAVNNELVAIFGNFVNRTWVLMHKWFMGKVPRLNETIFSEPDNELKKNIQQSTLNVQNSIEEYRFREALFEIIDLARKGNQYLQKKEPWKKVPELTSKGISDVEFTGKADVENTIHLSLQLCANLAILLGPFLPNTARKMQHMMKVVDKMLDWENAGKSKLLSVGYSLRAPELLFRKIEDEEIKTQVEKLRTNSKEKNPPAGKQAHNSKMEKSNKQPASAILPSGDVSKTGVSSEKPVIQYEDFAKLDLKIGTIVSAEKVEKADKLLKLEVDLGSEKRIIISGIALYYKPEETVGKQVVVITNLAPRKMKGIESNGMVLTAEDSDGNLHFISPGQNINPGSGVS
jgi:methionyl-tRNA synthetase